ncbi:MAG: EipA family protein [Gammaproteobacteria bacterium]
MNVENKFAIAAIAAFIILTASSAWAENDAKVQPINDIAVQDSDVVYDRVSIIDTAERFFGDAASGIAQALENAIESNGPPVGYVTGEEVGAAFFAGVRYGSGVLTYKHSDGSEQSRELYWQGPSAGYDFGANASRVMYLVYDLNEIDSIYQRFPAVDGNLYIGAGLGMTYQRSDGVTLIPVRAGVGLRGGANIGYIRFTPERRLLPF